MVVTEIVGMNNMSEWLTEETEEHDCIDDNVIPEVGVEIFGEMYTALIDTGSQVTGISSRIWNKIVKQNSVKNIPKLPVTNMSIIGAYNKKPQKINMQVKLPVIIKNTKIETQFLIIPGLNVDIIFGCDMLNKYLIEINFEDKNIKMKRNDLYPEHIVVEFINKNNSLKINTIIPSCELNDTPTITQELRNIDILENEEISKIDNKLKRCRLSENSRRKLKKTLIEHIDILTDRSI